MGIKGFKLMSEIKERPREWLWPGRIAAGELTVLEGHPGVNKSSLMYDLAARLTQGQAMPCCTTDPKRVETAGALFLIAEDSLSKTVKGRLLAAGADLTRLAVVDEASIPDDLLVVEKAIRKVSAKLVVIDTLNDFLGCNTLGNQQVRRALRPLRDLAEKTDAAVVALRHFVKSSNGHSLLRGGGSGAISALARSQIKLYLHPDDPNLRVILQDKSSLAERPKALIFEVVPVGNEFRLEWHGHCDLTIDDLERKHKGSPTLEAAERLLLDELGDGPKEVNWLLERAKGLCSKRTLDEAKKNLDVETTRKGRGKNHKVYWQLNSLQNGGVQGVDRLIADGDSARSRLPETPDIHIDCSQDEFVEI